VTCVGFNHDCSLVVTGDMAGVIKVWSVVSQQEEWSYEVDELEASVCYYVLAAGILKSIFILQVILNLPFA